MIKIMKWGYIILKWYLYTMVFVVSILLTLTVSRYAKNGFQNIPFTQSIQDSIFAFLGVWFLLIVVLLIPKTITILKKTIKNKEQIIQWIKDN